MFALYFGKGSSRLRHSTEVLASSLVKEVRLKVRVRRFRGRSSHWVLEAKNKTCGFPSEKEPATVLQVDEEKTYRQIVGAPHALTRGEYVGKNRIPWFTQFLLQLRGILPMSIM